MRILKPNSWYSIRSILFTLSVLAGQQSVHAEPKEPARPESPPLSRAERERQAIRNLPAAYRLDDGQVLKFIPPKFAEGRQWYCVETGQARADDPDSFPQNLIFVMDQDGLFHGWTMYSLAGGQLRELLDHVAGVPSQQVLGEDDVLETAIVGDFVVRKGASPQQLVVGMRNALARDANLDLEFEFVRLKKPVWVATGTFSLRPLDDSNGNIEVFGSVRHPESGAGGGRGNLDEFLTALGRNIKQPIVNAAAGRPKENLGWRFHASQGYAVMVLPNVTRQTGLAFAEEKREIEYLKVSRKSE